MADYEHLKTGDTKTKALEKIATLESIAARGTLWIAYSHRCPIPCASETQIQEHKDETLALLHYARLGIEKGS